MISVSIVEDDAAFREMLVRALAKSEHIRIVGKHTDAKEALREIPRESPDVILMDINLPGMSGIECLRRLRELHPKLKSRESVLTGDPDSDLVFEALKAGADGYLTKDEILGELWKPIRAEKGG